MRIVQVWLVRAGMFCRVPCSRCPPMRCAGDGTVFAPRLGVVSLLVGVEMLERWGPKLRNASRPLRRRRRRGAGGAKGGRQLYLSPASRPQLADLVAPVVAPASRMYVVMRLWLYVQVVCVRVLCST